ncbi:MAG: hypothetical protein JWM02_3631, partial [Frankiales bacterium]|nr:hypothetical protein [Frankiales bacterium]
MFPTLPTDNLYKFVALAGCVTLGASIYFGTVRVEEL